MRASTMGAVGFVQGVFLVIGLLSAWGAESPGPLSTPPEKETTQQGDLGASIRITSDAVESDHRMKWLEFTGNVKATQEDGAITADRIKVFYTSQGHPSGEGTVVEKIVSEGNVRIVLNGKPKTAVAEKAVYTAVPKVLVLSGGGPTMWSGKNVIRGEKITLFLEEDRTLVEGGDSTRVDATFVADEGKGLAE
ncbi:MAG: LptA/OstA family protein [Thermodesulfobacteriota bacterium]|nr:LptA/OstA family protein [Thermodesulfobacteriota bacterium]